WVNTPRLAGLSSTNKIVASAWVARGSIDTLTLPVAGSGRSTPAPAPAQSDRLIASGGAQTGPAPGCVVRDTSPALAGRTDPRSSPARIKLPAPRAAGVS